VPLLDDELAEVLAICPGATEHAEGGRSYVYLPKLRLPDGCEPSEVDALLWPQPGDGYSSRLYYAVRIQPAGIVNMTPLNWNGSVLILERTWHAHSWRTPPDLRPAQMIAIHLRSLR